MINFDTDFEKRLAEHQQKEEIRLLAIEDAIKDLKQEHTSFKEEMKEPMEAWKAVHGFVTVMKWVAGIAAFVVAFISSAKEWIR